MPHSKIHIINENALSFYHYFALSLHKRQFYKEEAAKLKVASIAFFNEEEEAAKLEIASIAFSQIPDPFQTDMDSFNIALQKWIDDYIPLRGIAPIGVHLA